MDEANKLLEEHSDRATSESFLAVKKKFADANQKERDRKVQLESLLESIAATADPNSALKVLEKCRELVRTSDEKAAVGKLESQWREKRDTAIASLESEFRKLLQAGTSGIQRLESMLGNADQDAEVNSLVAQVQKDLTAMSQRQGSVAKELASQATLLESRLAAIRKSRIDLRRREQLLDKLASAAFIPAADGTARLKVEQYFETLREYEVAFPNDPITAEFKKAAENDALKQVSAKRTMIDRWNGQVWPEDMDDLERRLQACKTFLADYTRSPDLAVVKRYEAILKSFRRREFGDEVSDTPVKELFRLLLSSPLIGDGHTVRTTEQPPRTFYLPKAEDFTGRSVINFRYICGYDGELKTLATGLLQKDLESPMTRLPTQASLTDGAVKEIPKLSIDGWDDYHQKLVTQLLDAQSVDPFIKYILVLKTLEYAGLGNLLLEEHLARPLKLLDAKTVDLSVPWMDPDNKETLKANKRAAELLKELNAVIMKSAWNGLAQSKKAISGDIFETPSPIGCLDRSADGSWTVRSVWNPNMTHQLYCVTSIAEGNTASPLVWRLIGRKLGKDSTIEFPREFGITQGMVVFATLELLPSPPTQ